MKTLHCEEDERRILEEEGFQGVNERENSSSSYLKIETKNKKSPPLSDLSLIEEGRERSKFYPSLKLVEEHDAPSIIRI